MGASWNRSLWTKIGTHVSNEVRGLYSQQAAVNWESALFLWAPNVNPVHKDPKDSSSPLTPGVATGVSVAGRELKMWVCCWNMETINPFDGATEDRRRSDEQLHAFVPKDCDVYIVGLQESPDEGFNSMMDLYLMAQAECVRVELPPEAKKAEADSVYGRGDKSFVNPKCTCITAWVRRDIAASCKLASVVPFSFGAKEGSKGAVMLLLQLYDTTVAFLSCHLSAAKESKRVAQYGRVCRMMGAEISGDSFEMNELVHHVVWIGDMNYRMHGVDPEVAIKQIRDGELDALKEYDELITALQEQRIFFDYHEPDKAAGFFPTYKKKPHRPPDDYSDPKWVETCYRIYYKEPWYKGGRTMPRVPGWCDRILWHSAGGREGNLLPTRGPVGNDGKDCDTYLAENQVLRTSDHSAVHCTFKLQTTELVVEPAAAAPPISMYNVRMFDAACNSVLLGTKTSTKIELRAIKAMIPAPYEVHMRVPTACVIEPDDEGPSTSKDHYFDHTWSFVGQSLTLGESALAHTMVLSFEVTQDGFTYFMGDCCVQLKIADFIANKTITFHERLFAGGLPLRLQRGMDGEQSMDEDVFAQFSLQLFSPAGRLSEAALQDFEAEEEAHRTPRSDADDEFADDGAGLEGDDSSGDEDESGRGRTASMRDGAVDGSSFAAKVDRRGKEILKSVSDD